MESRLGACEPCGARITPNLQFASSSYQAPNTRPNKQPTTTTGRDRLILTGRTAPCRNQFSEVSPTVLLEETNAQVQLQDKESNTLSMTGSVETTQTVQNQVPRGRRLNETAQDSVFWKEEHIEGGKECG